MTSAAATGAARARPGSAPSVFRDDGRLSRAIGRRLGGVARVPALALIGAGALPLALAIAIGGSEVSTPVAGVVLGWVVVLGGVSSGRPLGTAVGWAAPAALRLVEYGALLWIGTLAGDDAVPGSFALMAVIWFRHYDLIYRLRLLGRTPARWIGDLMAGWEGRLLIAYVLLAAGALPGALYALAGLFAVAMVAEAVVAWRAHEHGGAGDAYVEDHHPGE